jgi:hypothetical protein
MAYKFQLGSAILSGSTKFEELVEAAGGFKPTVDDTAAVVADDSFYFQDSDGAMKRESMVDYATAIAGDGLSGSAGVLSVGVDDSTIETNGDALRVKAAGINVSHLNTAVAGAGLSGGGGSALAVDLHEFTAEQVASGDFFAFVDSTDNGNHKDTVDDLAILFAGNGLSATSAVMAVDLNELTDASVDVSADSIAIVDANDSNGSKKESIVDLVNAMAGTALQASSGQFRVKVTGSMARSSGAVGLSGSMAGSGLSFAGDADAVTSLALDIDELTALGGTGVAQGDHFVFSDDGTEKKITFSNMEDAIFGNISSDVLVAAGGAATIQANAITNGKMADDSVGADELIDAAVGVAALNSAVAGDGLTGGAGSALAVGAGALLDVQANQVDVDLTEAGEAAIASGDYLIFLDGGATGTHAKENIDDIATLFAGAGLGASSAQLSVQVSGALGLASGGDHLGISGSFAGNGLTYEGGVDSISSIAVNVNSTSFAISSDEVQLASGVAGDGLALGSHALSVNVDDSTIETDSDALRLKDNGVTLAKMAGLARGKFIIGDVSGDPSALALGSAAQFLVSDGDDLLYRSLSGDATMNAAGVLTIQPNAITGKDDIGGPIAEADELLISDNGSLKRTDVSRLRAMTVAARADGDTLATGVNYFADLTSDAGVTLPASPQPGDKVIVKAKDLTSAVITISRAGSHTIDGETAVVIESPFGAVTCVYVAANDWRLI